MTKKALIGLSGALVLLAALAWWGWGWYRDASADQVLLARLEQLLGARDWKVTAVRSNAGFVTVQAFVLHQGEVVRSSDETPGRVGAPQYIVKNGKFYSLISDYEIFETREKVPRAFIEADLSTANSRPALSTALAAMHEAFPLYYTRLSLKDREKFLDLVAGGEEEMEGSLWGQTASDTYVRTEEGKWPNHIPQSILFSEGSDQSVKLELQYVNTTGYAGAGPSVELTFTPVDDLDTALRFPADYVRVEAW